jgi:type I restriction enzyme S subunit
VRINGETLPASWCRATIGETCEILAGYGFPESLQGRTEGDVPFYKVGDISEAWKQGSVHLTKSNHYVSTQDVATLRAKLFPASTTVFAKIGAAIALNRRAILSVPALADNNVMGLHPNSPALNPSFLYYFTLTLRLAEISQATTVPSIRKPDVGKIEIPLAPQNEQTRIVAEIEKQFTRLDAAVAALKRVQASLKRYRASVLKAACEGRLVPTEAELARREGRSYEPADKTIARLAASLGTRKVRRDVPQTVEPSPVAERTCVPPGWAFLSVAGLLRIGALLDVKDGNHGTNHPKRQDFSTDGLPFITAEQVNNFQIDYLNAPKLRGAPLEKLRVGLAQPEDVILTHKGTVGRVAVCNRPCMLSPQTTYYRTSHDIIYPKYLSIYQASPVFFAQLAEVKSQTTRDYVPISDQYKLFVLVPPRDEQERIALEAERRISVLNEVNVQVESNLQRAERLRQAILKAAFEGKLVPQDPTDEPASILLERIRGAATPNGTAIPGCAPPLKNKPRRKLAHPKSPLQVLSS